MTLSHGALTVHLYLIDSIDACPWLAKFQDRYKDPTVDTMSLIVYHSHKIKLIKYKNAAIVSYFYFNRH